MAYASTDGQRGREDASRHTRPGGQPGGNKFQRHEQVGALGLSGQHFAHCVRATAKGAAPRRQPDDGNQQPDARCKPDWKALAQLGEAVI